MGGECYYGVASHRWMSKLNPVGRRCTWKSDYSVLIHELEDSDEQSCCFCPVFPGLFSGLPGQGAQMADAVSALPFTAEFQVKPAVGRGYSWMGDQLGIASC